MKIYRHPLYYEIAFSFIDPKEQVDNFEKIIRKFSKIKVNRFLDIACGPSLQLREIARRGYKAIGLDLYPEMLEYLRKKAKEEGVKIETVQADMYNFRLKKKADFAFIMMGSLDAESNEKFLSHLDSVAASLNKGGLYFIQNMTIDWTQSAKQSWSMERDGISVEATFETHLKDVLNQIYTEEITLVVNDHGKVKRFTQRENLKFIFPQEFKTLIKLNGKFEFLGWWKGNCNTWHLDQPLEKAENLNDNMVLLRRK
ncbi:MAG: class I SAM-dependent methyltransferase [Candidatus Bathyarchaeota archaeon]|jgi:SAM-dependent methyltransferase|nr:class I SAM-dependent methyltransferase [Candidatus Bathyarchaeota archaeon A05DMB-5]MDH7557774.1 class I SAM-dependent methyltransferase [Candidatus Bathyarchaeota archaeon]